MIISKSRDVGLPIMNMIRINGFSILQQLHLEERLLRASSDNWCIINNGTNQPNLVMGISGKPEELIEVELVLQDQVPVIRRFTGGGTVIVDDRTIFVTFICNKNAIPGLQPYPRPIMSWTGQLYKNVFQAYGNFQLCENGANQDNEEEVNPKSLADLELCIRSPQIWWKCSIYNKKSLDPSHIFFMGL